MELFMIVRKSYLAWLSVENPKCCARLDANSVCIEEFYIAVEQSTLKKKKHKSEVRRTD